MPHYEFQLEGGIETRDEFFSMSDAPRVGETIVRNGKTYRRVFSVPQLDADITNICHKYPYESFSLPEMPENVCKKSPSGLPIVRSQNHEREICAMTGRKRF